MKKNWKVPSHLPSWNHIPLNACEEFGYLKSWYQTEKHPFTLNARVSIDPLCHVVADFRVSLSLAMWSQDTHCSESLLFPFFLLIWSKICMSYILAIPFFPVNSHSTVLKLIHFLPWFPPLPRWKCPISIYLSFSPVPSLLNSEIPSLKTWLLITFLPQLSKILEFRFSKPVGKIIPHCCRPKLGQYTFTHRNQCRALLVLSTIYIHFKLFIHCVLLLTNGKLSPSFWREVPHKVSKKGNHKTQFGLPHSHKTELTGKTRKFQGLPDSFCAVDLYSKRIHSHEA